MRHTISLTLLALPLALSSCNHKSVAEQADQKTQKAKAQETPNKGGTPRPSNGPPGMQWIPGGSFVMGSSSEVASPDEGPEHEVTIDGFWLDTYETTNAEFARFVKATKYVTTAEKPPDMAEMLRQNPDGQAPAAVPAGSIVFEAPEQWRRGREEWRQWFRWKTGACWKRPMGPTSSIEGKDRHPVVHVSYFDVQAYAKWVGKRLPTEAEWEFAARGGLKRKVYCWGDESEPDGKMLANFWQGTWPAKNTKADGYLGSAPVGQYPPNGYGLHDMAGNVWEWTADWYRRDTYQRRAGQRVVNPRGPASGVGPGAERVTRGGSFLCANEYCHKYRPSARMHSTPDTSLVHTGFRLAISHKDWLARKAKKKAGK